MAGMTYFLFYLFCHFFTPWGGETALNLAFALLYGYSALPFIAFTLIIPDVSLLESVIFPLGGLLLREWLGPQINIAKVRSIVGLLLAASASTLFFAIAQTIIQVSQNQTSPENSALILGQLWAARATGMFLLLPLLLSWRDFIRWPKFKRKNSIEGIIQALALFVISWEIFIRFADNEIHFFYLLFFPLVWIAFRHGQKGVILSLAFVYGMAIIGDKFFIHREMASFELQIRMLALAAVGLLLGAQTSENLASQQRMTARQNELAHVLRLNVGWEMASGMAHELNQPLAAAMNFSQAARRFLKQNPPQIERSLSTLERSIEQIERVGQIIKGLRDFMKKGELQIAPASLKQILEEALQIINLETAALGINISLKGEDDFDILADKTQIVQVLVNILRNACQAIHGAGLVSGSIEISSQNQDKMIEIRISDNGPGLSPEIAAHIFEPFVTSKSSGMGLGLSISKSIIEAHEGRLSCEPNPKGQGTVFCVTIPKVRE